MNERLCRLIGTLITIGLLVFSSAAWALEVDEEWLAYYDTPAYAEAFFKVQVDAAGNAYVLGDSGLLKYGSDGVLKWHVTEWHRSLRTDPTGNSYSSRVNPITNRYELVKYDTQGTLIWARNDAEQGIAGAQSVLYADIQFGPTWDVIVASKVSWIENYTEKSGIRVLKYSQDGTLLWDAWEQPGPTQNYVAGLATDPGGDVAVAILDVNTPGYELVKYSADGTELWRRFITAGHLGYGEQVAADAQGNVFLFIFNGIHKFNGTTGEEVSSFGMPVSYRTQISIDASSSVVASGLAWAGGMGGIGWVKKLDNDLNLLWEVSLGSNETPVDLATDEKGNVFLVGYVSTYPPRIVTWAFDPAGVLSFRDLYAGVWYGYGNSLAVLEGKALYVAASTWYYRSLDYGGVLIKYNIRSAIPVGIDIKPGNSTNAINLGTRGTVPVAILSTSDFDATRVDPLTVTLASAAVALRGNGTSMAVLDDVDGDGRLDMVVHVSTEALQLSETDTEAILQGRTVDGIVFEGVDSVRIVP